MKNNKVITRFPPSPTGFLHIGRARTALFNYLFAKKNDGKMVFRLEDTDRTRSKKEYEDSMIESLKWLGISWDNEVIERQSERTEIYKKYLRKLVDENKAYLSKEKIEEGEKAGQENEVVRFKNPNTKITFTDLIRGDITFDTTELGDFIIARNIDEPLYHLTVVVDDFEMGITHIIRGDDGISNTPRQILIQQGIGAPKPIYAHLPLILAPDKSKLSGRHGAVSVTEYEKNGYLPQALINYLALLGWNPGTEQEIFSIEELIQAFEISKIQKAGAVFNIEKLNWFNKQYISKMSDVEFSVYAGNFISKDIPNKILPLIKEKISYFGEIEALLNGELSVLVFGVLVPPFSPPH
jgi:glutamyl/glutaminyl-tRNA synthetase